MWGECRPCVRTLVFFFLGEKPCGFCRCSQCGLGSKGYFLFCHHSGGGESLCPAVGHILWASRHKPRAVRAGRVWIPHPFSSKDHASNRSALHALAGPTKNVQWKCACSSVRGARLLPVTLLALLCLGVFAGGVCLRLFSAEKITGGIWRYMGAHTEED